MSDKNVVRSIFAQVLSSGVHQQCGKTMYVSCGVGLQEHISQVVEPG